ncbi:unnamed protein product [Clonostachys chloroleuca]|uniref:Uncharacterized protein n=1 Tax=Clonostachys chloroleuca TaxID=1926264 RepID=A0AA35PX28_9HYPO|nr:unnamed protein product [Clonostachys chloroleuca]
MKQPSHSSDQDGWSHLTSPATSQNRRREIMPGHSPNNAFDNPSGINGNSFLYFGAGIDNDTSFSSQPQCSQDLTKELEGMQSAPSCPIMLTRNSMNPQFLECFQYQYQPCSVLGQYDCEEPSVPLLDRQGSNPFQTTSSAPIEVPPGSSRIPEIFLTSAGNTCTESEDYYSSSYSSGQEASYPGTPHTPSVTSPRSDAGSFAQMHDERQPSFSYMSASSASTYATSCDGYEDDATPSGFDRNPGACLLEQPSSQYLQPGPLAHSYTYPLGRESRSVSNFIGSTFSRRSSDIAPNCSTPIGEVGTDTLQSSHTSPIVISDRPRSSSDSFQTRPPHQSLKRARESDESQGKNEQVDEEPVVGPDMEGAPLEPRRARGKRKGPLSETTRSGLKRSRTDGNTCLNCCLSKVKCDGTWFCIRCAQGFDGRAVPMCTKAHFKDMIKKMSTLSSMPPSLRAPIFELLQFPVSLDEVDISHETLGKIKDISADWNLEIYYRVSRLRTIDMEEMWRSLATLQKARLSPIPFPAVFDKHYSRGSRPEKTYLRSGNLPAHLMMYVRWTNVLKFTTLQQVSKKGEKIERIAPNGQIYHILTQVVLIELRRFERNIYEVLSKSLHQQGPRVNDPNAVPELVTSFGYLLLSLRWQICVWKKYRPALARDINQGKRELRFALIQDICRRLYPYYFLCRDRCLPDPANVVPGMETHYANMAGSIRENFPTDFSEAGFEGWIDDGNNTVRDCRVDEQSLIQSIL